MLLLRFGLDCVAFCTSWFSIMLTFAENETKRSLLLLVEEDV